MLFKEYLRSKLVSLLDSVTSPWFRSQAKNSWCSNLLQESPSTWSPTANSLKSMESWPAKVESHPSNRWWSNKTTIKSLSSFLRTPKTWKLSNNSSLSTQKKETKGITLAFGPKGPWLASSSCNLQSFWSSWRWRTFLLTCCLSILTCIRLRWKT